MRLRTSPHLQPSTVARARALRRDMTDAERALWRGLRESLPAARFRGQVPFEPYFPDFASHRCRLVVEVDGGQHAVQSGYDAQRTALLQRHGYRVLRYWNHDVLQSVEDVVADIHRQLTRAFIASRSVSPGDD